MLKKSLDWRTMTQSLENIDTNYNYELDEETLIKLGMQKEDASSFMKVIFFFFLYNSFNQLMIVKDFYPQLLEQKKKKKIFKKKNFGNEGIVSFFQHLNYQIFLPFFF